MPQNKPMKIQWITVNGRQVPLVLPQTYSYKDDDWKITSDQDPLPIVEYGTTEGGVIVPKRVSNEGHELTQLTGSNLGYTVVTNQVVPAGSTYLSNAIVFKGTRLAVGIRFNATTQFEVRLAIYAPDISLSIGQEIVIINQTSADRGYGDTKLFSNRGAIVVYNRGQNDVTIQRLAVTEFMASGNGGAD